MSKLLSITTQQTNSLAAGLAYWRAYRSAYKYNSKG